MIKSWRGKETKKVFDRIPSRKFSAIAKNARTKLLVLDAASDLRDLSLPGLRLERLRGDREGQYSVHINDQYRIGFKWSKDGAVDVEIVDYH